mmetsp:Transcript_26589/g.45390  ORF Transcript_26589/g.45390 Transcript_26589/m.45390 type:complete len:163 (+) Transcript_26589:37-525(+)
MKMAPLINTEDDHDGPDQEHDGVSEESNEDGNASNEDDEDDGADEATGANANNGTGEADDLSELFSNLNVETSPLRNNTTYQKNTIYRSSFAIASNGDRIAIGFGYVFGAAGKPHYVSSGGNRYDMGRRAPQICFNCEDRTDMDDKDKYHWRINCPRARGCL